MRLEQLANPMVDIYYPSQLKEMNHFIEEEEWMTGDVSRT